MYAIITRSDGAVLTGVGATTGIWNDDHQNHVTHTEPMSINSYEATVAQMQTETDPAPGGSPSLALSFADELARLRFSLLAVKMGLGAGALPTYWYTLLASVLAAVSLPPVACRREQSVFAQAIPNNILTQLLWTTTRYDTTGGVMSPVNFAITAPVAGVYLVGATVMFGAGAGVGLIHGDCRLTLAVQSASGSAPVASSEINLPSTSMQKGLTVETAVLLAAGDQVSAFVFQTSGAAASPVVSAITRPALWMALVSR